MNLKQEKLAIELSRPGRMGVSVSEDTDIQESTLPDFLLRDELNIPEMDELTVVRHFTNLSNKNFSIDAQLYPLGSCTMKYNPKVNETVANMVGWKNSHPLIPEKECQGSLELMYNLQESLAKIGGFDNVSLQPAAGAHGELTGVLMIRAYHQKRGDSKRVKMLIPDSAHGTNPASSAMAGFNAVTIKSDEDGGIDIEALKAELDDTVAGIMITNPNTLGLFERKIETITKLVHDAGALVYGDGANLNALVGVIRPGDLGIDVMHYNLHKTFSAPHGGGGPGVGIVAAKSILSSYLPGPIVSKDNITFKMTVPSNSIGRVKSFNGNFGVMLRAYTYIRMLSEKGLRRVAENAVLNANYIKAKLEDTFEIPYARRCMHEFVAEGDITNGVHTLDIAKRLTDFGIHPPTIYFPLIVHEAIMIEPTETESKETMDEFCDIMLKIADEAWNDQKKLTEAPSNAPVGRLDEVAAARNLVLTWR